MKILFLSTLLFFISSFSNSGADSEVDYLKQISNLAKMYNYLIDNLSNNLQINLYKERLESLNNINSNKNAKKHFDKHYNIRKNQDIKIFLEEYAQGCLTRNYEITKFPKNLLE